MDRTTVLMALTIANVALTVGTLSIVLFGARKVQTEVETIRTKTNRNLRRFKKAIAELDLEV